MPIELNDSEEAPYTRQILLGGDTTPGVSRAPIALRPSITGILR